MNRAEIAASMKEDDARTLAAAVRIIRRRKITAFGTGARVTGSQASIERALLNDAEKLRDEAAKLRERATVA